MSFSFNIPRANPIRIRQINWIDDVITNTGINYTTVFPRFDLMETRVSYQRGEEAQENYYPAWVIDKKMRVQIQADAGGSFLLRARNVNTGVTLTFTRTEITPSGWVGYDTFVFEYTFTTAGFYYFYFDLEFDDPEDPEDQTNVRFQSDVFHVTDKLQENKDIFELKYRNSINKYGAVWDDYYTTYYCGMIEPSDGELETSVFKTDTGVSKLNSKSNGGIDVVITDIPKVYKEIIKKQLECDDLLINGIPVVSADNISSETVDNSDMINVSFTLLYKNSDDYMNF